MEAMEKIKLEFGQAEIAKISTEQMAVRKLIQALLKWDDDQYSNFQFEKGIELLESILSDQQDISMFSQNKLFWKEWLEIWNFTDTSLLATWLEVETKDFKAIDFIKANLTGSKLSVPAKLLEAIPDRYINLSHNIQLIKDWTEISAWIEDIKPEIIKS